MRGRVHEYGYRIAGALAGGVAGAMFDQLTCTVSPEYFRDGKAIAATGTAFRFAVAWVGFRGGLPLGALVAGADILVRTRRPDLGRRWWLPHVVLASAASVAVFGILFAALRPFDIASDVLGWDASVTRRFFAAWGCHVGAYVGTVAGVASVALRAIRTPA